MMRVRMVLFGSGALMVALFALTGCSDSGTRRFDVSGSVTFQGNPVPSGTIAFDPVDGSMGGGFAAIQDGRYDTAEEGRGHLGGPHTVLITGNTGKLVDPDNPDSDFESLFTPYETTVDLPTRRATEDFEIP